MASSNTYQGSRILVLGGTGAQGTSVVRALSNDKNYQVSVLTRDTKSPKSQSLVDKYGVRLISGSYTTENGLRAALLDQDVVYFNIDSFSVGEPLEYFWTFRAYEIAVQYGLKWFILSGSQDKLERYGYKEEYRNSHNVVSGRLSTWLSNQPQHHLKWTIITGGVYAEMLGTLLRPTKEQPEEKLIFKVPLKENSVVPLVPLERYGLRVLWALRHPDQSYGKFLTCSPFQPTVTQIVESMKSTNAVDVGYELISIDMWMEGVQKIAGIDPERSLPRDSTRDDSTAFTFRKSFGAWWAIWRENRIVPEFQDDSWLDSVGSGAVRNLTEWMIRTGYDGGPVKVGE